LSRTQRLGVVLLLNLTLVAGLVTTGAAAHSLAVLAAGGDYLLDAAGTTAGRPATRTRRDLPRWSTGDGCWCSSCW
jgi:Co/Zn/Cd efflux system component